jgi:hypothetical protein
VGSYEQSFTVDGVEYELYRLLDELGYQLVDHTGRPLADFTDVPDRQAVVTAVRDWEPPQAG